MPDILIRNIDKEVLERLKNQAKRNNRSLQEELKEMIEIQSGIRQENAISMVEEVQEKYRRTGTIFPDSSEEISKERQR